MNRPWQDSPTVCIAEEILRKVLNCTNRFPELLIAAILGITAVATTAAGAGVALHQSIQTVCKNGVKTLMFSGLPKEK